MLLHFKVCKSELDKNIWKLCYMNEEFQCKGLKKTVKKKKKQTQEAIVTYNDSVAHRSLEKPSTAARAGVVVGISRARDDTCFSTL